MTDVKVEGRFVVAWVDQETGKWGHGTPTTYIVARAWVQQENERLPYISHAECDAAQLRSFLIGVDVEPNEAQRRANEVFAE